MKWLATCFVLKRCMFTGRILGKNRPASFSYKAKGLPLIAQLKNAKMKNKNLKQSNSDSTPQETDDIAMKLEALNKKLDQLESCQRNQTIEIASELREQIPEIMEKIKKVVDVSNHYKDLKTPVSPEQTSRKFGSEYIDKYGTADPSIPISNVQCNGCGAILHCQDPHIPGYLASEIYVPIYDDEKALKKHVCQRCQVLNEYNMALNITVNPKEYLDIIKKIRNEKSLILLITDLTDLPHSIIGDLLDIVGTNKRFYVIGNKVDLLPNDGKNFLSRVKETLIKSCNEAGLTDQFISYVGLVSARTGYGVEELITKMINDWQKKGDVYVIGCTNVGKSSLFNTLLGSDYCNSKARDLVHRATTSVWPGTTLSLLKFPILSYSLEGLRNRTLRLIAERKQRHLEGNNRKIEKNQKKGRFHNVLSGNVGITFEANRGLKNQTFGDHLTSHDLISYSMKSSELRESSYDAEVMKNETYSMGYEFEEEIYPVSKWCFDTPGLVNPQQLINYLTQNELSFLVGENNMFLPQTVKMKLNSVLLVGGLGRVEYLEGCNPILLTVFSPLPIKVGYNSTQADDIYRKHCRNGTLAIPSPDPGRLNWLPSLVGKEFRIIGKDWKESAADIILSSAGWVSVTAGPDEVVRIRAYTPASHGLCIRTPPMLPFAVNLKGKRITQTALYEVVR